jgi:hypothetical protein
VAGITALAARICAHSPAIIDELLNPLAFFFMGIKAEGKKYLAQLASFCSLFFWGRFYTKVVN